MPTERLGLRARRVAFVVLLPLVGACSGGASPDTLVGQRIATRDGATRSPVARSVPQEVHTLRPLRGIYVSANSEVAAYPVDNRDNMPPLCTITAGQYSSLMNIDVDPKGDLMVPLDEDGNRVQIYRGHRLCGALIGTVSSAWGLAVDAASRDAATGPIAFALAPPDSSLTGGIEVCTIAKGCTELRTSGYIFGANAVAMDRSGDCWAASEIESGFGLYYFKACSGTGVLATGWVNDWWGGLDIDARGDLLSIDANGYRSLLYVYAGCKPVCTTVGGPFRLRHRPDYGHLNGDGTMFATAADNQVDVYSFSRKHLRYQYSFNNGIPGSNGVAFSPGR
jgi:hypothetical protein